MTAIPRLALFDLDGTLVDSAPDLAAAIDGALRAHGRPAVGVARVRELVGPGAQRLVHRALTGARDGVAPAELFEPVYASFLERYTQGLCVETRVFPGVETALRELAAAGWTLAVVTNKPARFTAPLLEATGLARHFAATVSGDTLAHKKPDPAPLLHAAAACGIAITASVMVGDSASDITAARRAGMPAVCVDYGYAGGDDLESADAIVSDLRELPGLAAALLANEPRR
ncbi:MAG: phosphoglycolate phosphatase, partial [Gammaproteobacteria bacterium]